MVAGPPHSALIPRNNLQGQHVLCGLHVTSLPTSDVIRIAVTMQLALTQGQNGQGWMPLVSDRVKTNSPHPPHCNLMT